jgi:hypothetical protein
LERLPRISILSASLFDYEPKKETAMYRRRRTEIVIAIVVVWALAAAVFAAGMRSQAKTPQDWKTGNRATAGLLKKPQTIVV